MTHADDIKAVDGRDDAAVDTDAEVERETPARDVTVHECSPERTVFTENGNSDGWIATDTTVELDQ
jgi:hypothetical protein